MLQCLFLSVSCCSSKQLNACQAATYTIRYNHILMLYTCLSLAQFSSYKRSILASGDISEFIPKEEADVAVLEEPEHLTWYYHGKRWTDKFQHVVGIVHTNYLEYVKREKNGAVRAFMLEHINNWMVRAYCNKVLLHPAAPS